MKYHNKGRRDKQKIHNSKLINECVSDIVNDYYFYNVEDKEFFPITSIKTLITLILRQLNGNSIYSYKKEECKNILINEYFTYDFFLELMKEYAAYQLNTSADLKQRRYIKCYEMKNLIESLFNIELDDKEIGMYQEYKLECTCGTIAEYDDTDYIKEKKIIVNHNTNKEEFVKIKYITHKYKCPTCGKECYTHRGTNIPYGNLANSYIRRLRADIHNKMNLLYRTHNEKSAFYKELSSYLGINSSETHISMLTEEQLNKTLDFVNKKQEESKIALNV